MKKIINKIPSIFLYMIPLILVFTIMLLAFWPGILSPDAMVQFNQVQTGNIDNWHPAYTTLFIKLLTSIWHSPTIVIIVQYIIISLIFSYTLTRLEKYYNIDRKYLFIASIIFAIIPLNFNFAINMLKDTLYSYFLLLLLAFTLDLINNKDFLKKWYNVLLLILNGILICLYRHNGILVILLYAIIFIIVFRKQKVIYLVCSMWIISYLLLTTVGFNLLNIAEANYANKYGPISHIFASILNNDEISMSNEELNELSKYVDIEQLKSSYNQYNMDYSINAQNVEYIKNNSKDYIKFALKEFTKYPLEVIKYYLNLDSYLYSPYPFKGSYVAGMFTETELYIYENDYPQLHENSKIKWLNNITKKVTQIYQSGAIGVLTMRPALYLYATFICILYLVKKYKNKILWLLILPSLFNTISLAPAMPVASTRYVYITLLTFYIVFILTVYKLIKKNT